jgi:hypothetical protein
MKKYYKLRKQVESIQKNFHFYDVFNNIIINLYSYIYKKIECDLIE